MRRDDLEAGVVLAQPGRGLRGVLSPSQFDRELLGFWERDHLGDVDEDVVAVAKAGESSEPRPLRPRTQQDVRYTGGMASTTIKLSVETRERIRAFGGDTYEDTVVAALDLLEAQRFWQQAETAAVCHRSLSGDDRGRRAAEEAAVDAAFDGLD